MLHHSTFDRLVFLFSLAHHRLRGFSSSWTLLRVDAQTQLYYVSQFTIALGSADSPYIIDVTFTPCILQQPHVKLKSSAKFKRFVGLFTTWASLWIRSTLSLTNGPNASKQSGIWSSACPNCIIQHKSSRRFRATSRSCRLALSNPPSIELSFAGTPCARYCSCWIPGAPPTPPRTYVAPLDASIQLT